MLAVGDGMRVTGHRLDVAAPGETLLLVVGERVEAFVGEVVTIPGFDESTSSTSVIALMLARTSCSLGSSGSSESIAINRLAILSSWLIRPDGDASLELLTSVDGSNTFGCVVKEAVSSDEGDG